MAARFQIKSDGLTCGAFRALFANPMGGKAHDRPIALPRAQSARLAIHIIALCRGANDHFAPLRCDCVLRRVAWHNDNHGRYLKCGKIVGVVEIVSRQIDRKASIIGAFDSVAIVHVAFAIVMSVGKAARMLCSIAQLGKRGGVNLVFITNQIPGLIVSP